MVHSGNLILTKICVYPVKSLGAISLDVCELDELGLQLDRRWMLVDENHHFVTQRQISTLCFFETCFTTEGIRVTHKIKKEFEVLIPFKKHLPQEIEAKVWQDICLSYEVDKYISKEFSEVLNKEVKLVYMPLETKRQVDENYASQGVYTSFTDGFPLLMIGEESLKDLNSKLENAVPMQRFRPNLIFSGGYPFIEDDITSFFIGTSEFNVVKPCSRCVVTTINPENGEKGVEPLATLAKYRLQGGKVMFGQNVLVTKRGGEIKVGQKIQING